MIKKIHVKNYILINDITVDLAEGLNVITGETGSGKSVLINAIDVAFGAKASKDLIKTGTDKATIELTLSVKKDISALLDDYGIDNWGDEMVISREISPTSSRSRVNGTLVNMEFLKRLKELFLDIHSQHQTYSFMQPNYHINLLDAYSKDIYGAILNEYKNLWTEYQDVLTKLHNAQSAQTMTESQIDFLKFQIDEISSANIEDINEDENLQNELNVLSNAEKLKEYTTGAFWTLSEDDNSSLNSLMAVKSFLSKASSLDENLAEIEGQLIDKIEELKDIASEINSYASRCEFDQARIDEIQERIYLLDKLKRKYGVTLEDVINTYEKLSEEYSNIEASDEILIELTKKVDELKQKLEDKVKILSENRKEVAEDLSKIIEKELSELELPKSKFVIALKPCELNSNGAEHVEFLISTNISEDVKPLIKVASGGEISRVMLAIKSIFAQNDDIDTVIFDEIDTGISGKASISVAEKISNLAKYRQIILITHQAIIASKADNHIYVSKKQDDVTTVSIKILSAEEKLNALAELASGEVNEESLDFARSLVQ